MRQSLLDIEKPSNTFIIHPSVTNRDANVAYQLESPGRVNISVFDVTGRKVKTLIDGYQLAGSYDLCWDRIDERGQKVGNGIYFMRLEIGKEIINRKMIIVK